MLTGSTCFFSFPHGPLAVLYALYRFFFIVHSPSSSPFAFRLIVHVYAFFFCKIITTIHFYLVQNQVHEETIERDDLHSLAAEGHWQHGLLDS